jgi:predicted porin
MQKNLLAVAVGGALVAMGAPTVAVAQTATVSIYGTFYGEYSRINNGNANATTGYRTYDHFQNPGSEIGFRGEEKLGGNMSAWFQCTSSMDYRGSNSSSSSNSQAGSTLCTRNSALGMKGPAGNIFYGNWNTPFSRVSTMNNTGSNDTGLWGNAHIMTGTSTTTGISSASATTNNLDPGTFRKRQNSMFTYETPVFSGFQGMAAITSANFASNLLPTQVKTRLGSIAGTYNNGPLSIGAAYEKHWGYFSNGQDESAWTVSAGYTFANNLKLGGIYHRQRSDQSAPASARVSTYHLGIDWKISGPHGLRAAWSHAGDLKGTGSINRRPANGVGFDTSANQYQIRYVHTLSKRTELTAGYTRINNGNNANYEIGGSTTSQFPGKTVSGFGVAMRHTF